MTAQAPTTRALDRRAALAALVAGAAGHAQAAPGEGGGPSPAPGRRPSPDTEVDVRAFGAVGDGRADDTRAIQAAIDHALRSGLQTVRLPAGRYRTTDTVHLGWGDAFVSVSLVGETTYAYAGALPGSTLLPERTDRPALNVQGSRGGVIRAVSVVGRNVAHLERVLASRVNHTRPDPARWLDPALAGALRRHAPYAGITVDAFSGPARADGYARPALPGWLARTDPAALRRYSSNVVIDRCFVGGFAVGIAVQPGDADGNGDFVKILGCQFTHGVYAIAVGNSQSRNVAVRDCDYAMMHTFLTNRPFGRGVGTLTGPIENCSGALAYQFMDVLTATGGPLRVSHLYFEGQVRLGVCSNVSSFNHAVHFDTCVFNFGESLTGVAGAAMLEAGSLGAVRFTACAFGLARRMWAVVAGAGHVGFRDCLFGILSDFRGEDFYRDVPAPVAQALNYTCGGAFVHAASLSEACALDGGNVGLSIDARARTAGTVTRNGTVLAQPGRRVLLHHYARAFVDRFGRRWAVAWRRPPNPIALAGGGVLLGPALRIADDRVELHLAATTERGFQGPFEAGDILYAYESRTLFVLDAVRRERDRIVLAALWMNNLPAPDEPAPDPLAAGTLWHYPTGTMLGDTVYYGDFAAGSPVVANVHRGDGSAEGLARNLLPGDLLHACPSGPPPPGTDRALPYPAGTSLSAVDEAARRVTLSAPALASGRHLLSTVLLTG